MPYTEERRNYQREYMRRWREKNGGDYPRRRIMYARRAGMGLCSRCGEEPRAYRALGKNCLRLCSMCSAVRLPDRSVCGKHVSNIRDKKRRQLEKRRRDGRCEKCNYGAMETSSLCQMHHVKQAALNNLGSTEHWVYLLSMFERTQSCYLCGVFLRLGDNAQVDHVMPRQRFPELARELSNVRWACRGCNESKRDKTLEEFVEMCDRVLAVYRRDN